MTDAKAAGEGPYKIVAEAIGSNENKKNEGGLVIKLYHGSHGMQEVSRVGYIRRNTKNPKVSFDDQLTAELDRARAALRLLNEQFNATGQLL